MADSKENILIELKIVEGGKPAAQGKKEVDALVTSIIGLRQENKKLAEERNKLDTATAEGSKRIKELNDLMDKNTEIITKNSTALEKKRFNVGNYTSALDKVIPGLKGMSDGFLAAGKSAMAFLANPIVLGITLIVGALAGLVAGYSKSATGARDLHSAQAGLSGMFKGLANDVSAFVEKLIGEGGVTKAISNFLMVASPLLAYYYEQAVAIDKSTQAFERNKSAAEGSGKLYLMLAEVNKRIAEDDSKSAEERVKAANRVIELLRAGETVRKEVLENRIKLLGKIDVKTRDTVNEIAALSKELDNLSEETEGRISPILQLIDTVNKKVSDDAKKVRDTEKKELQEFQKEVTDINNEYREREKSAANELELLELTRKAKELEGTDQHQQALIDLEYEKLQQSLENTDLTESERALIIEKYYDKIYDIAAKTAEAKTKKEKEEADKQKKIQEDLARRIAALKAQELGNASSAAEALSGLIKRGTAEQKAATIASIVFNTAAGVANAVKAGSGIPWPANLAAILSGIAAVLAGIGQAKAALKGYALGGWVALKKYAQGGAEKFLSVGGRSHAQGGTKYYGEDGNAFEVERGEGLYVLSHRAQSRISELSAHNQKHGGNSWTMGKTWYAAQGGQIETRQAASASLSFENMVRAFRDVISSAPRQILVVDEVTAKQTEISSIQGRAQVL